MNDRLQANSFDHVALWVSERERIAELLCRHLGMHEITTGDDFTLVGVDAKEGKLTLFDAEPPRERGVLDRVVLRVHDLHAATPHLPPGLWTQPRSDGVELTFPDGLRIGLVEADGIDYDLDRVILRVPDPAEATSKLGDLGFAQRDGGLAVAGREVRLTPGDPGAVERPLLNHLALLVDSVADIREAAEARGLEIDREVDAENTLAVFVRGPADILVEYVEHKPGFSLS